jgi:aminomethyltransferase
MSTPPLNSPLKSTPLHTWHQANGGRLVDFAGWSMPVQYTSILDEHHATRKAAGLFDVSHMARIRFDGAGADKFLDGLLTRRVEGLAPGKVRYSLMTNEAGGILDDVLVYSLEDDDGTPFHWLVVNAGNREKISAWLQKHLASTNEVTMKDVTLETAMIAVQGPMALSVLKPIIEADLAQLSYYTATVATVLGHRALISRTGYTGEDGCELVVSASKAASVWQTILDRGAQMGFRACGLGARDTLRLEAAMPLYGHELSESTNPLEADLEFAVNLKDRQFIGSDALNGVKAIGLAKKRVGIEVDGKRPPREGYAMYAEGEKVGQLTSGAMSPTLQKGIGMGYVPVALSAPGTEFEIDLRGTREKARVIKMPFYQRAK